MKKTYINPNMEVVRLKIQQNLLVESNLSMGEGTKATNLADGHDDDFDW